MIALEITLAVLVLAGVVVFGLLIALGNERQRRELEGLRKDAEAWALGDLAIKRSRLATELKVGEPRDWLNHIAKAATGADLGLDSIRGADDPEAILATARDGRRVAFSHLSPAALGRQRGNGAAQPRGFAGRLREMVRGSLSTASALRRAKAHELTALDGGMFFDLEAQKVWEAVTGKRTAADRWWLYVGARG